jgi:hypothetical protein
MNLILKHFLIIGITFIIILWFQYQDDKKHKKERKSYYDEYKFPLLVSSIVGLVLNLPVLFDICEKSVETISKITVITPVKNCETSKTFIHNKDQLPWIGNNKLSSDQQIFTDLPDF